MNWLMITSGITAFSIALFLAVVFSRKKPSPPLPSLLFFHYVRISRFQPVERLLKKASRIRSDAMAFSVLHHCLPALQEHLLLFRQQLKHNALHPLSSPCGTKMLRLAQQVAESEDISQSSLLEALLLHECENVPPTELSKFPLYVGIAQYNQLTQVLKSILRDYNEKTIAIHIARRLKRSKYPRKLLERSNIHSSGITELLSLLQRQEQHDLLKELDNWFDQRQTTAQDVVQHSIDRQMRQAEEIRKAEACFNTLSGLDWLPYCEQADQFHALLLDDPSGLYPRMTHLSRFNLRKQVEGFCRATKLSSKKVLNTALCLSREAEARSTETYIGYWFQDAAGMRTLRTSLGINRGQLHTMLAFRQERLRRMLLWASGFTAGFLFLQAGNPVWMLPFFTLAAGSILRNFLKPDEPALPALETTELPEKIRTLVLLPVTLRSPQDAIQQVRRLKILRHAFPDTGVDFLLLGDFEDSMTLTASQDGSIIHTASAAIAALGDERCLYLHRSRKWDSEKHICRARCGREGAIEDVCRLIAQGECETELVYASLEPASLERTYDYVLAITPKSKPAAGMLQNLVRHMAHPICGRFPIPGGWRGYSVLSPAGSSLYNGIGLIRPDAFLESIDGIANMDLDSAEILGELAGHAAVSSARLLRPRQMHTIENQYHSTRRLWSSARWQLPWVKTPSGLLRNPLSAQSRFLLREQLRYPLVPLAQCALLLWAVLSGRWILLVLALLVSLNGHIPRSKEAILHIIGQLALLPAYAAFAICGMIDAFKRKQRTSSVLTSWMIWAQGIFATIISALGLALPGAALPALSLGVLFACFPLMQRLEYAAVPTSEGLSAEHISLLQEAVERTWRFFSDQADFKHCPLPPCDVQFNPDTGASPYTSPEAIGAALLACICAKDLGFIHANQAAQRIQIIHQALAKLPMPFDLPCRRYHRENGTVHDPRSDAAGVGFLLAALMTTAQALRCWLPEIPEAYRELSAALMKTASSFQVLTLYDPHTKLFYEYLDENGQGHSPISCFTDESLLLSVAACSLGLVGPDHFEQLRRTCVRLRGREIPLSRAGNASAHLLPRLFLPLKPEPAQNYVSAIYHQGANGLFGKDTCAWYMFDPSLKYQYTGFGLPEAALTPVSSASVFSPYAASLCLPFMPQKAGDALLRFQAEGAYGPLGYCDAIDYTHEGALIGLYDTYHQAILLTAATHMLADAPVQRYFCMQPGIEACLPLLEYPTHPLILPIYPRLPVYHAERSLMRRTADVALVPAQRHLLGTTDFHMLTNAHGACFIYDHDVPLLASGDCDTPGGIHFYLADEGRIYRIGDPHLPGEVVFSDGETRITQTCGSLKAELLFLADTIRRRAVHVLTITNLSTRDRIVDTADFLLPDLGVPANTLEVHRFDKQRLSLHARSTDMTLYHSLASTASPLSLNACTERIAFLGRGRTLNRPASLEKAPQDKLLPSEEVCLSFRARLALGGRGQITIWFTTSFQPTPPPQWQEISSLCQLAAIQHTVIRDTAHLNEVQASCAERLLGPLTDTDASLLLILETYAGIQLLSDLISIMNWMRLHGFERKLWVRCNAELRREVETICTQAQAEENIIISDSSPIQTSKYIILNETLPLLDQIDAMYSPTTPVSAIVSRPSPASLPRTKLIQHSRYGGFDPETGAYVIELEPGMNTPVPWTNRHHSRYYHEVVNEAGIESPYHEQVWLHMNDGTCFSPWDDTLPRRIHMEPGTTIWETWTDKLDIRLCAAVLPNQHAGIRILRIRNATSEPLSLQIKISACFPDHPILEIVPGIVMGSSESGHSYAFLAGANWNASRIVYPPSLRTDLPPADEDRDDGRTALLCQHLMIAANSSGEAIWMIGETHQADNLMRMLDSVNNSGAAAILRRIRASWSQRLSTLSITSPEQSLDLLMNSILPVQGCQSGNLHALAVLMILSPSDAKWHLLQYSRETHTQEQWAWFVLHLATYVRHADDQHILDVFLPQHDAALFDHCSHTLQSLALDQHGLPMGERQAYRCLLFALAVKALDSLRPTPLLNELSRKLLNAGDTYLWEDGCYGRPLQLDVQALACFAYGSNVRTRQAMRTAWTTLYDPVHGLIRQQEPTDIAPLPGSPENGGMCTFSAALALRALIMTGNTDEAHELLRALNPIHHCDDTLRMEIFRDAPYRLHGGMHASPMEAGRAAAGGGDEAACLLYAIILEDVLGLHREGNAIRLEPHVPGGWHDYTITLREGASTWHISVEKRIKSLTVDGLETEGNSFTIADDGGIHQVRIPLS